MRITVYLTDNRPDPWIEGLKAELPDAEIEAWRPGAPQADHAVVWAPPQQFIDEQPALRGIFNIGAGVDALLKLRIPAGTRIVRLDDAGMSVQMAEYVCHTLIRHFREFDAYEADAREGKWSYRRPKARGDFPVGIMGLGVLGERVAKAVAQFEFPVLGWSRSPKQIEGVRVFSGEAQFDEFLSSTRVLVNLLPLTEAAGATLDVFQVEPLPADHAFWRHPKIVVTPHGSARTLREESIAQIAGKIRAMEQGLPVAGVVDPVRGY